jgi:mRNA interferase RelE/StbE
MYSPYYSKRFAKQIKSLPPKEQLKVLNKIKSICDNPREYSIKLQNTKPPIYRLRVGEYRVFFELDDSSQVIQITDIKRRTTQTY